MNIDGDKQVVSLHQLDAQYKPFPNFIRWSKTFIETTRWNKYVATLNNRKSASPELLTAAQEVVKRATAVDTGAIEGLYETDRGFTYTIAVEATFWQSKIEDLKGPKVRAIIESQINAYDYVLDLATSQTPISEASIRTLHEKVCASQTTFLALTEIGFQEQTLPKGEYKQQPNHVLKDGGSHSYAPVEATAPEMYRLCQELRSDEFVRAHPVLQASYAHYAFVVVHPFADGNGRVARALGSVFTYREQSVPLLILAERKNSYLDALEVADKGNYLPFVTFILNSTLDSMQMVEDSIKAASQPKLSDLVPKLENLSRTKSGYKHSEIDEAATNLAKTISDEINALIQSEPGLASSLEYSNNLVTSPIKTTRKNYRVPSGERGTQVTGFQLAITTKELPNNATIVHSYHVIVPADSAIDDDMLLVPYNHSNAQLLSEAVFNARVSDLLPNLSIALQMRVKIYVQGLLGELISELHVLALSKTSG